MEIHATIFGHNYGTSEKPCFSEVPILPITPIKLSIIIPSAPHREIKEILTSLHGVRPRHCALEIFIIKGTWPPLQRNLGINKATGDYIFLFDDDVIISRGSIEKALETFQKNPQIQVVGGPNLTPPQNSFLQHCFGYAHASFFVGLYTIARYCPAKKFKKIKTDMLISCNLAFRAEILKKNLFNPDIFPNEENELLDRIARKRSVLGYNPDFFVYHHRRKNIRQYIRQIFQWGKGRVVHWLKKPACAKIIFFMPLLFLIYLMIYLATFFWYNPLWYRVPLLIYLFLDIIFTLEVVIKAKNSSFVFIMPWLFPLTHLTYAIGTLWGLVSYRLNSKLHPTEKDFQLIKIEIPEDSAP